MSDKTVLVVMHEGSYSDQTWNTYEVSAEDVDAFVALSEHFGDADLEAVFPTWSDAWMISRGEWDSKAREYVNAGRRSLCADPAESLVAKEAMNVIKAASEAKLGAREFEYAKRCFLKDTGKVWLGYGPALRPRADLERIFGIRIEGERT